MSFSFGFCQDREPSPVLLAQVETGLGIIPVSMGREVFDLSELEIGCIIAINADIKLMLQTRKLFHRPKENETAAEMRKAFITACFSSSKIKFREFKSIRENFGKISIPRNSDTDSHLRVAVFFCQAEDRLQWVRSA